MDSFSVASIRLGGQRLASYLEIVASTCQEGVTGIELDTLAYNLITQAGDLPAFLNHNDFPKTLCISLNDEVIHGIPSSQPFKSGDLVGLDLGLIHLGWYFDSARTISIGEPQRGAMRLLQATSLALEAGINACRPGGHIGDISAAIESVAQKHSLGIIRDFCGHGLGRSLHLPPNIPNTGKKGSGPAIKPGMILAIEPMFVLGAIKTKIDSNGWTVRTLDSSLAAHFEHTVMVTSNGVEILTKR